MKLKGSILVVQLSTRKHRDKILVTAPHGMLEQVRAMYLVACHSDASVYSLINSPEWLHGELLVLSTATIVCIGK
jgi:hypothetical protein